MTIFRLITCAALAFAGAAAGQSPSLWIHPADLPAGNGARAHLYGQQLSGGPFPVFLPVEEPRYEARAVVPLDDGAYVILPVNGGGASGNLDTLLNPSWLNNRGWQILRVNATGQLLWQRSTRITQGAGYMAFNPYMQSVPELGDALRTSNGGLALIAQGGLIVFDPQGTTVLQLSLSAARCGMGELESFPDRAFLSQDDALVLGYASQTNGASRACAVGFDGQEIESISTDAATAMGVVDYRRNAGFLVGNGVLDPGNHSWSNTSISLRTATSTRWSLPSTYMPLPNRLLAPNGDAWLDVDSSVRIYDLAGSLRGQTAEGLYPKLWLAGGDVLIADDAGLDVRRVQSDGDPVWQRSVLPFPAGVAMWQLLPDRVRMMQVDLTERDIRSASLALADGQVLADDVRNFEFRHAVGLAGNDRIVTAGRGPTLGGWSRELVLGCDAPGYCPDAVEYAQPEVLLRSPATGATIASIDPAQLSFPLATPVT